MTGKKVEPKLAKKYTIFLGLEPNKSQKSLFSSVYTACSYRSRLPISAKELLKLPKYLSFWSYLGPLCYHYFPKIISKGPLNILKYFSNFLLTKPFFYQLISRLVILRVKIRF